jgi:hypothetical protein
LDEERNGEKIGKDVLTAKIKVKSKVVTVLN